MASSHSPRERWGIGALAFCFAVLLAFLWQGSLPELLADPPKDPDKKVESDGKYKDYKDKEDKDHGRFPCDSDVKGGGQGWCIKHRRGTWVGDAQNFPQCSQNSWVCNNPGAACSDAAVQNGHCTITGAPNCNCRCMP